MGSKDKENMAERSNKVLTPLVSKREKTCQRGREGIPGVLACRYHGKQAAGKHTSRKADKQTGGQAGKQASGSRAVRHGWIDDV